MPPTISIWDGLRRNNDRSGKMRSRTTMELFQYWNEVRGGRDLPRRDETSPPIFVHSCPTSSSSRRRRTAEYTFVSRAPTSAACSATNSATVNSPPCGWRTAGGGCPHRRSGHEAMHADTTGWVRRNRNRGSVGRGNSAYPPRLSRWKGDRILGALSPLSRPIWLHMKPLQHLVLDSRCAALPASECSTTAGLTGSRIDACDRPFRMAQHLRVFEGGRRN